MTHINISAKDMQRDCINYTKWLEKAGDHANTLMNRYKKRFTYTIEKHRRSHPIYKWMVQPYTDANAIVWSRYKRSRFARNVRNASYVYPKLYKRLDTLQAMADKLLRSSSHIKSPTMSVSYDDFSFLYSLQIAKSKYTHKDIGEILKVIEY